MLSAVVLFLSVFSMATPSFHMKDCVTNVLINDGQSLSSLEIKRITSGEGALNKEFRQIMAKAKPGNYDKHTKATTVDKAKSLSKTGKEHAQYLPSVDRVKLERHALVEMKGYYKSFSDGGKKGTIYKFVKFKKPIGFDLGEETQWLRVEWSSHNYHGHPISIDRLAKQCPDCIP